MEMKMYCLIIGLLLAVGALAGDKEFWKSRTIYQLLTDRFFKQAEANTTARDKVCPDYHKYCGGNFKGIVEILDYVKDMGFDAIWISPVVENIGNGYHGYHAKDLYKINPKFGTEEDLKNVIAACHESGIAVMVDVVANHMGPMGVNYTEVSPFNKSEHYHDVCQILDEDWRTKNQWAIENCRLANLPDLKQENPYVEKQLLDWIKWLVTKFNIDGLRIDTVPEVPKWFWTKFREAAGVYTIGEVFDNRADYIRGYIGPLDSALNYAMFDTIRGAFKGDLSMLDLRAKIEEVFNVYGDNIHSMGLFFDNHDNVRFLNTTSCVWCLRSAITFTLFFPGIPIFYYGDEQLFHGGVDPENREPLWPHLDWSVTYQLVQTLVKIRKARQVWKFPYIELHASKNALVFQRGDVIAAFSNDPEKYQVLTEVKVPYPQFTILRDAFTRQDIWVMEEGKMQITLGPNEVRLYEVHFNAEPELKKTCDSFAS